MCSVWKSASLNFSQKISHEYLKLEGDRQREEKKWVATIWWKNIYNGKWRQN